MGGPVYLPSSKSRQSRPTLCDPIDGSPLGSCPWGSPRQNTRVGYHFLLHCVKVKSLSCVRFFATPWTIAYQAPPSMGFTRQEYWSGLPLPSLIQRFPCHCILASTVSLVFLMIGIPTCLRWYLNVPLTSLCISLRINTVDHIFTYLLAICVPF